jgi:hypothetical protein
MWCGLPFSIAILHYQRLHISSYIYNISMGVNNIHITGEGTTANNI